MSLSMCRMCVCVCDINSFVSCPSCEECFFYAFMAIYLYITLLVETTPGYYSFRALYSPGPSSAKVVLIGNRYDLVLSCSLQSMDSSFQILICIKIFLFFLCLQCCLHLL